MQMKLGFFVKLVCMSIHSIIFGRPWRFFIVNRNYSCLLYFSKYLESVQSGSFDCSFLLLLCFCCYHFRKLIDFSTLYGIYRRYGCLSKCTKKRLTCPQPTHNWFDWLVFFFFFRFVVRCQALQKNLTSVQKVPNLMYATCYGVMF